MGARNPDTVRAPPMPAMAVTAAEMRAEGWTLRATCGRCRVQTHVDLNLIIIAKGPDYVMWGRTTQCKVWTWGDDERCSGRMTFEARSIRGGSWRSLRMSGEVQSAIQLRNQMAAQRRG